MILEDGRNPVTKLTHIPNAGNMLHFSWVYRRELLKNQVLVGFLVVYSKAASNSAGALAQLQTLEDAAIEKQLLRGGWVGGTGRSDMLIRAVPAGEVEFKVLASTFRPPCRIEVWAVVQTDGKLALLYQNSDFCQLTLRLTVQVRYKEFRPAEYGRWFRKLLKPAVTGVELTLSTDNQDEDYMDGAVRYRIQGGSWLQYPIAREALGKPLQFVSDQSFAFSVYAFEITLDPDQADLYELVRIE